MKNYKKEKYISGELRLSCICQPHPENFASRISLKSISFLSRNCYRFKKARFKEMNRLCIMVQAELYLQKPSLAQSLKRKPEIN